MAQRNSDDNSYLRWYWAGWPILIVIMITLRVTVLWSAPKNIRIFCVFLYALGAVGLVLTTYLYESGRLLDYLRRHYPAAHARTLKPHWSRRNGPYPVLGVIFSNEVAGDPVFERLRTNFCLLLLLWVCVFLSAPCLCGMFMQ